MENYSNNSVILNKSLIKKYPWLIPRSRRTGKVINNYDYTWTELDAMPKGWREAFGELLCEEIQEEPPQRGPGQQRSLYRDYLVV